ncbi:ArsR/SmtB family transcription factor [Nocardia cyriacigeorgica]|uniref:Helix-turn-helix domain n=1 Tax=Nocardia cyriacigeorgica TaxID=135487 RepID=A0A4U8VV09_9NOCA|nr:helix-turn-helix domain-containing protein [Nocardia cyriacigeorgica]MBF6101478.1 helix-turn-helix transcriptional regulator [Nocardia cyriacigeorgica]MBF6162125.1 helix-turn-helix transcriptional regulator [Nocardia cyriacigeorgica]MBF6200813.1 helix-turn-helix transcriptional regulator [Nocardia cyriacigeorgica]VFA97122.1 Helix-turn-helix domain [Nocardia cyriacigeorgica]
MPLGRWKSADHPAIEQVAIDDVLHALADPTRRRIVRTLLADGDRPCGTFDLDVAASTLSHHFKALRKAGIIRQFDVGRQRMNTLRLDELGDRFPGLVDSILALSEPESPPR